MKILKSELAGALKVLGKCGDLVKITEKCLSATNGTEMVTLEIHPLDEEPLEAVASLFALRQAVGCGKSGEVEFKIEGDELGVYETVRGQNRRFGVKVNAEAWPVLEQVPEASQSVMLSDKFAQAVAQAAQVVDRSVGSARQYPAFIQTGGRSFQVRTALITRSD
ncbi:MAG: hypothetical protein PHI85_09485 [Victivallaceae bacterium]|nr:hypothetical protein [Victivallaceae bacterium]